jgi:hypothetical protein
MSMNGSADELGGRTEAQIRRIVDRQQKPNSRRELLRRMAGASLGIPLWKALPVWALAAQQQRESAPVSSPTGLSPEDDKFLDDLERANFLFFWEQANPETGLIKDRCNVRTTDTTVAASIASTGFGLTAICIAEKRGFISHEDARLRVIKTLDFIWKKLPTHRGFFFHFANMNTGERMWDSEVSSIDTAILLCGILTCRQHFRDRDIFQLSHAIFDRVDWSWISEDIALLSMGWTPEMGFLPSKWNDYSELMMIYLLGMGSSSHPLKPDTWFAWKRTTFEYDGMRYIGSFAPLFVNQFSQAWFDFRHKRDKYADYFQNSVIATEVHRLFCVGLARNFPDYSDDLWGITASDSVVPAATGGSLPFLPEATMRVLKNIKARYPQAWSRYGFVDAFNPLKQWYDKDVIGIDTGITMLMAENVRTSFVWETFMKNPEAQRGMAKAGFTSYNPAVPST